MGFASGRVLEKAPRLGNKHADQILNVGDLVLCVEPYVREEEVVLSGTRWVQRRPLTVKVQS